MSTAHSDKMDALANKEPLITKARNNVSSPGPMPVRVNSGAVTTHRYIPSLSLDPRNVELLDGVDDSTIGYVRCAIDAFGEAFVGLQRLSDAREQIRKDTSKTEANQILIIAKEAETMQNRATRAMDSARTRLMDGIKALDESLSKPMTTAADNSISAEVRKFVRELPDDERQGFLNEALKKKDIKTLQSILGAQPFLSGINDVTQAHFTRALHEQQTPEIAKRVAVMRKALSLVESRGSLVITETTNCLGASWETIQKLRQTQGAVAQALLLINPTAL